MSMSTSAQAGIGYTLATGRLFCPVSDFHKFAEELLGRSIWTYEFASDAVWSDLRTLFEAQRLREMG